MNKKAALELSINAIVIVILAMTLLGLGLGFVRNMFSDLGGTVTDVQDNMRQQILDDLRRGDKKISFPTEEVKLLRGNEEILAIGVKNTIASELSFAMKIWIKDSSGETEIYSDIDLGAGSDKEAFYWDDAQQTLTPGDDAVYGVKIAASKSASGTRLYKIKLLERCPECVPLTHPKIGSDCNGAEGIVYCEDRDNTLDYEYMYCDTTTDPGQWTLDDNSVACTANPVYASEDFFVKII